MKQSFKKFTVFVLAAALLMPASLLAQNEEKEQTEVKEKKELKEKKEEKEAKEKKEGEQIIITRKGDKDEKVTVEINGDKITVNGKPLDEYKNNDGDVNVVLHKLKDIEGNMKMPGAWSYGGDNNFQFFNEDANHAMLGVTTEKVEQGVEIQDITKESAAEKAGLKENDIITKIDDTKIEDPDDLSEAIQKHKPEDKVAVTYLRDKKEQKVTAQLTKWKGADVFTMGKNFKMDLNFDKSVPRAGQTIPRIAYGQNWSWSGGGPKLGLSVQDTDDGKGVKVIDVDDEGNAEKAGIKEDDVITDIDGKAVNNTDEVVKIIKDSKDKTSLMVKLQRGGKTQNIEVKMPRKLKTADL